MTDVTHEIEVRSEAGYAFGGRSYEIWHNGEKVGDVTNGKTVVTNPGYVLGGVGKRSQILAVTPTESVIHRDRNSAGTVQDPKR